MKVKLLVAIFGSVMALSSCIVHSDPPPQTQTHNVNTYHHDEYRSSKPYVIQNRINDQERAINNGIRSGSLTKNEARTLRHNLGKIKAEYNRAKKTDRHVSYKERERLDQMLDHNDRMIRKLKGNYITRF